MKSLDFDLTMILKCNRNSKAVKCLYVLKTVKNFGASEDDLKTFPGSSQDQHKNTECRFGLET